MRAPARLGAPETQRRVRRRRWLVLALVQSVCGLVVHSHRVQDDHLLVHVGVLGTARVDGDHSVCAVSGIQARGIALCHDLFSGISQCYFFWIADGYLKASSEHAGAHENDDSGFSEEKKVALVEDVAESELKICNPPWSAIGTVRTTTTPSGTEEQEGGAKPAVSAAVV